MKKTLLRDLTYLIHPYQKVVIIPDNAIASDYFARTWISINGLNREVINIFPQSVKNKDYLCIRVKGSE